MMRNGFRFTLEAAQNGVAAHALEVTECSTAELPIAIQDAHVAVPLMSRFDESLIRRGKNLKMILQFGVGLEGVDIPAVCVSSSLSLHGWHCPVS
jgi:phosphoglycerate dehydrogenase-like enzyme